MDLILLRAFITVAREGNLTRAAVLLHLTQPAVSLQIKHLQETLGVTLFTRTSHGLSLTRDGQALLPHAERALAAAADVQRAAQSLRHEVRGRLRIGTILDPAFLRLGGFLKQLVETWPHIETALRLSPRDPMTYMFFTAQALCKFVGGDYSGALASAERSISIHPSSDNHLYMAAALAELGEMDQAHEQIKRALSVSPKMSLVVIGRGVQGNPGWQRYHAALRKAGLPE